MKKLLVIGGGTGTSVVLSALKKLPDTDLKAIVVVSDNGGSTGRLRDEFGFLPVGDMRQCIAALASGNNEEIIRKLLLYRFGKDSSLQGHNLGNLILTALEDLLDSPARAVELASKIFRTAGKVYPVTEDNVQLLIQYEDGKEILGEKFLDDPQFGGKKIEKISFDKKAKIYEKAAESIRQADFILLGPGDLYGSLLPNSLVDGFSEALQENKKNGGKFFYISNLMTHFSQTNRMSLQDHVTEIEKYCQRKIDRIIVNKDPFPKKILELYQQMHEFPVLDDMKDETTVVRVPLLSRELHQKSTEDETARNLLRHDRHKLLKELSSLFEK